jgi:hypothetical protein
MCQPDRIAMIPSASSRLRPRAAILAATAALLLGGCASAPLERAGSLRSYDGLTTSDSLMARSQLRVDKARVLAASTVRIVPTRFSASAERVALTPAQRRLVANAVDRTLCSGLSERFRVVGEREPADLTVAAVITALAPTDTAAAGVSRIASVARSVALPGVPVPVPRIPIGLGSLSLEAEARGADGGQLAAMIWGRGASAIFGPTRVSEEGDAYTLATAFGIDFSRLLVTGETPFQGPITLPSAEIIALQLGAAPRYPACEAFGRTAGLVGIAGEALGVPPGWTDTGGATLQVPAEPAASPAEARVARPPATLGSRR